MNFLFVSSFEYIHLFTNVTNGSFLLKSILLHSLKKKKISEDHLMSSGFILIS